METAGERLRDVGVTALRKLGGALLCLMIGDGCGGAPVKLEAGAEAMTVSEKTFPGLLTEAWCSHLETACEPSGFHFLPERCRTLYGELQDARPVGRFHADRAALCLESLPENVSVCATVYEGDAKIGEDCHSDFDCAGWEEGTALCVRSAQGRVCRVLREAPEGRVCDGDYERHGAGAVSHSYLASAPQAGPLRMCARHKGLECEEDKCVSAPRGQCLSDVECPSGEQCGFSQFELSEMVCQAKLELGERCCNDLQCGSRLCEAREAVCIDPRKPAEQCSRDDECSSGLCEGSVCLDLRTTHTAKARLQRMLQFSQCWYYSEESTVTDLEHGAVLGHPSEYPDEEVTSRHSTVPLPGGGSSSSFAWPGRSRRAESRLVAPCSRVGLVLGAPASSDGARSHGDLSCEQAVAAHLAKSEASELPVEMALFSIQDALLASEVVKQCGVSSGTTVEACFFLQGGNIEGVTADLAGANQTKADCVAQLLGKLEFQETLSGVVYRLQLKAGEEPPPPVSAWKKDEKPPLTATLTEPLQLATVRSFDCSPASSQGGVSFQVGQDSLPKEFESSVGWFNSPLQCELEMDFGCEGEGAAKVFLGSTRSENATVPWLALPFMLGTGGFTNGAIDYDTAGSSKVSFEIPAAQWHAAIESRGLRVGEHASVLEVRVGFEGECRDRDWQLRRASARGLLAVRFKGIDFGAKDPRSREAIHWAFRRSHIAFQRCYERALGIDPKLAGQIVVNGTFGDDGRLDEVRAEGELSTNEAFTECIEKAAHSIRLPEGAPGFGVTYPLMFGPE